MFLISLFLTTIREYTHGYGLIEGFKFHKEWCSHSEVYKG
jgi:hypothetical protein